MIKHPCARHRPPSARATRVDLRVLARPPMAMLVARLATISAVRGRRWGPRIATLRLQIQVLGSLAAGAICDTRQAMLAPCQRLRMSARKMSTSFSHARLAHLGAARTRG